MEELYCSGCGVLLQSEDENKDGYVNPNALNRDLILCKRCFQLKHYGTFVNPKKVRNTLTYLKNNGKVNDLIILVCDCSLCYTPFSSALSNVLSKFKNIILVANRYDLYKDYINKAKLHNFLLNSCLKAKIKVSDIYILDNNEEEIYAKICAFSCDNDVYLIGNENAGKSTFVNKLLAKFSDEGSQNDGDLTTISSYPGTTVDLIKIEFNDKHYLIDTPGIISNGNFLKKVSPSFIKKMLPDSKISPIIYQINKLNAIIVSNILALEYLDGPRQSVVFYGSNQLKTMRCQMAKLFITFQNNTKSLKIKDNSVLSLNNLDSFPVEIKEKEKMDIVIEGLGFFSLNAGKFVIHTLKGCNIFIRKAMI